MTALERALLSAGLSIDKPMSRAVHLRRQAAEMTRKAQRIIGGIPGGQPVRGTADRNRRERSMEYMRKAVDLVRQAEEIESKESP